ncbi:MAG: hypothetical protein OEY49_18860 [Candidatus Heimdallarchaeota archaeon]|nr:hypothetical protein [Candidatus Heimdallarchaeota archaeon]
MSTVAEEYGLDNLEEGKSFIPTKRQAEIELSYNQSIQHVIAQKYMGEHKTSRDIGKTFGVSHQTVAKWIKELGIKKSEKEIWITDDDGNHFKLNPPKGKQIIDYHIDEKLIKEELNETNAGKMVITATLKGFENIDHPILKKELSKNSTIQMTKAKYDLKASYGSDPKLKKSYHYNVPETYLSIINDPDFIYVGKKLKEQKKTPVFVIGKFSENGNNSVLIIDISNSGVNTIKTAYTPSTDDEFKQVISGKDKIWEKID